MKNIIPENSILEITPTNIKYTHKNEEINKTFLLSKDKIKNNLSKMDFSSCNFFNKDDIFKDIKIAPVSFIFFKLFAQKTKIPHPQLITTTYLETFCDNINNKYRFKENFIIEKQIEFTYDDIFKHICNNYNGYITTLLILTGIYKNNYDLEIIYEYKNYIIYNINLSVIYNNEIFLLTSLKNIHDIKNNKELINNLKKTYKNVHIISIFSNKKEFLEKTNNIIHFNDEYDKFLYNQIINMKNKKSDIEYNETFLNYDKEPFFIKGINKNFF